MNPIRPSVLVRGLSCILTLACLVCFFPAFGKAGEVKPPRTFEVHTVKDLSYYEGPGADPVKNRVDLYLPQDDKDFPVLFFIHGGSWQHGDKSFFGAYPMLGRFWASQGVGVVVADYRLSPAVMHPEHIKDVARAFAWTHANIAKYGGRADRIFVMGHSAGGHLAALLGTDESYLKAEGLGFRDIRGVISLSGVYKIPPGLHFFDKMFGTEAAGRQAASPLAHVTSASPPFLLIYGDHDLPFCGKIFAEDFHQALLAQKVVVQAVELDHRNHMSVLLRSLTADDPGMIAIRGFLEDHLRDKQAKNEELKTKTE